MVAQPLLLGRSGLFELGRKRRTASRFDTGLQLPSLGVCLVGDQLKRLGECRRVCHGPGEAKQKLNTKTHFGMVAGLASYHLGCLKLAQDKQWNC